MTGKRNNISLESSLRFLTPILAGLVTLYSVLALLGWGTNNLLITRIDARFIPMAPSTALCFAFLGVVLLLRQWGKDHRILRRVWQVLAGVVLLFNIAILLQFALDLFLG